MVRDRSVDVHCRGKQSTGLLQREIVSKGTRVLVIAFRSMGAGSVAIQKACWGISTPSVASPVPFLFANLRVMIEENPAR